MGRASFNMEKHVCRFFLDRRGRATLRRARCSTPPPPPTSSHQHYSLLSSPPLSIPLLPSPPLSKELGIAAGDIKKLKEGGINTGEWR